MACGVLGGYHDRDDRQSVLARELEVALVAAGYRHDGAGAVVHEHVVGHPDGDLLAVDRVLDVPARERAVLGALAELPLDCSLLRSLCDDLLTRPQHCGCLDQALNQRVLRREQEERAPEERVRPRGEHRDTLFGGLARLVAERELDLCALAATDPVGLHRLDAIRPAGQVVQVVEQLLRVVGDLEVPLLEFAFVHDALAAPAHAVADDLLVGKDRRTARAPVHRRALALDEPALPHLEEDPLTPAVVVDVAALDRALPVVAEAHALERRHLLVDVGVGPRRGVRCRS